jgi:hypothetical protein
MVLVDLGRKINAAVQSITSAPVIDEKVCCSQYNSYCAIGY